MLHPKPYRRWYHTPIGTPAVLLLLLALGGWLLWPDGRYQGTRPVRLSEPGVAYLALAEQPSALYMRHDLFARPSTVGFSAVNPERIGDRPVHVASRPTHLYADASELAPLGLENASTSSPAFTPLAGPSPPSPEAVLLPTSVVSRVLVSPRLQQAGFEVELDRAGMTEPAGDWEGRFCLRFRPDGRVSDALFEEGRGDSSVWREVVASLERARIPPAFS